ncbi:hypothetical protein [Streptomyces lydicus]|uniref:hypothetical protein n=1 Tax=Streptomyces lydicus TaxID=47763 RepID=UPI0037B5309F
MNPLHPLQSTPGAEPSSTPEAGPPSGAAPFGTPACPPEAAGLRERIAAFVRERVLPSEPVLDAGGPAARAELGRLKGEAQQAGLWALPLPVEYGGQACRCPVTRTSPRPRAPATTVPRPSARRPCWTC